MSAPQIPNLNTLRRGGGRGRLRGRGGGSGGARFGEDSHGGGGGTRGSAAGKDRVVQSTDNDASVSRLSAVALGYLEDPFARILCPGEEMRRLPIINRGTYVRTTAIDHLVARFLEEERNDGTETKKKQIVSLGAGSDTRVFRLLSHAKKQQQAGPGSDSPDIVYHEIDFAVNTASKIKAIRSSPLLQEILGLGDGGGKGVSVSDAGDALHSPSYHIHPLDLRALAQTQGPPTFTAGAQGQEHNQGRPDVRLQGVDPQLPTLLISECCLVYLSPSEAVGVLGYFTDTLFPATAARSTPLGVVLYEPIRPDDAFGRTMVANLAARGIHLQTLHRYASLGAQQTRLREQGFASGQAAADIDFIWEKWVSEEEKDRVAGLEMLDEMEEWRLLSRHYCIAWGWREGIDTRIFDGWRQIEGQKE
ncbi:hypothetical protein ASPZODRAFT_149456 [Penicilliopsis zonata CBS 506.65]|uniref:Leucine carboxyl methyltransferase 1 n=1 Tax=Penicilliopsis zonata CBS 506.65 TaxID=1073090 RepID=A0A1L9SSD8_9EURO|nr:hypothetical protein ASPZODRAFT_149456 [Penicilliopsis zonata CBS 506.65]OJJ50017.1 hypothetical protein ASPZODRAFT_149456 [Penicilliopsis zonata CBS 506.65]